MQLNKIFTLESLLIILFSVSLSFGNFNPFMLNSTDEEANLGLCQLFLLLLIPFLAWKYKGKYFNSLVFNGWQQSIIKFWIIAFLISLLLAKATSIDLFVFWGKILLEVSLCILLPICFRNKQLMYISIIVFSIVSIILSICVLSGLFANFIDLRNGRLWLWGENPNSSSCRWGIAIIFIVYLCFYNPLNWKLSRFILTIGIIPLMLLIIMSGSRGSLLITIFCLFVFLWKYSKISRIKMFFFFLLACIPLYFFISNLLSTGEFSIFERLQSSLDEGGDRVRAELLKSALNIFADNPLFGVGSTNFMHIMRTVYNHSNTVHNMYAHILAISGICGFIPFASFIFNLLKGCYSIMKKNIMPMVLMLFVLILAYKTGGILSYLFMWYIFSLSISFVNVEFSENEK